MSKIESLARTRTSPSEIHPGSKFACDFHFRHSLRLPFAAVLSVLEGLIIVPVETMGTFLLEGNPFKTVRGLVDYVSRLPRSILVVSLLVVSTLDIF